MLLDKCILLSVPDKGCFFYDFSGIYSFALLPNDKRQQREMKLF